jgi:hypothetical protein
MRKIVAILFLSIYSFTTVGATVHMHYCMNKLIGSSLYHGKETKCEKCGMHKLATKGCCKDEHKFIKLEREHHKAQPATSLSFLFAPIVLPTFFIYNQAAVSPITETFPASNSPPNAQEQKLYILNCIFRI